MSARLLALVMVAVALFGVGCAHSLEVRSEPPGADVYLDGEHVGQTPVIVEQQSGREDVMTVSVQSRGREARFAVEKRAWSVEAIVAGLAGAAATAVGGTVIAGTGYVSFLVLVVTGASLGPAVIPFAFGALGLLYGGLIVASLAGYVPFFAAGEWGRVGPDEVFVDFFSGDVVTTPSGYASPLVGVTEGLVPLKESQGPRDRDREAPRIPSGEDPRRE